MKIALCSRPRHASSYLTTAERWPSKSERRGRTEPAIPLLTPYRRRPESPIRAETPWHDLAFFNGLGGFSQDGREYVTILANGQSTPAPWVNVLANPQFGTVVSDERRLLHVGGKQP